MFPPLNLALRILVIQDNILILLRINVQTADQIARIVIQQQTAKNAMITIM